MSLAATISEEIQAKDQTLNDIVEYIAGVVAYRAAQGNNFGVVLIPEGLIEFIPAIGRLIQELNDLLAAHGADYMNLDKDAQRKYAYKYQSLASGFSGRRADPFLVTVEPKPEDAPVNMDIHPGQEFNMVWEGRMDLRLGDKRFVLEPGDCIYFDANQPHCMRALDNVPMRFLAIIF